MIQLCKGVAASVVMLGSISGRKNRLKLLRKPLRKLFALALWHCPEAATSPWTRRRFTSEVQRAAAISC